MSKLSYQFTRNGWELRMILNIENQKPINNEIKVNWCIVGIDEGFGYINLDKNKLYTENLVYIKPYKETGKTKSFNCFKIEKDTMIQIKNDYI